MSTTPPHPALIKPCMLPLGDALVANTACVMDDVTLGARVSIWYGAVLRGDCASISVGEETNIQDLAVVHNDTDVPNDIGAHVSVGHSAVVHGRRVGDGVLIGIGAIVLGGSEIGDDCIIAAGAVVKERAIIPPRSLVAGVPGKVVRQVSDEEIAVLRGHARHYWDLAQRHLPG